MCSCHKRGIYVGGGGLTKTRRSRGGITREGEGIKEKGRFGRDFTIYDLNRKKCCQSKNRGLHFLQDSKPCYFITCLLIWFRSRSRFQDKQLFKIFRNIGLFEETNSFIKLFPNVVYYSTTLLAFYLKYFEASSRSCGWSFKERRHGQHIQKKLANFSKFVFLNPFTFSNLCQMKPSFVVFLVTKLLQLRFSSNSYQEMNEKYHGISLLILLTTTLAVKISGWSIPSSTFS